MSPRAAHEGDAPSAHAQRLPLLHGQRSIARVRVAVRTQPVYYPGREYSWGPTAATSSPDSVFPVHAVRDKYCEDARGCGFICGRTRRGLEAGNVEGAALWIEPEENRESSIQQSGDDLSWTLSLTYLSSMYTQPACRICIFPFQSQTRVRSSRSHDDVRHSQNWLLVLLVRCNETEDESALRTNSSKTGHRLAFLAGRNFRLKMIDLDVHTTTSRRRLETYVLHRKHDRRAYSHRSGYARLPQSPVGPSPTSAHLVAKRGCIRRLAADVGHRTSSQLADAKGSRCRIISNPAAQTRLGYVVVLYSAFASVPFCALEWIATHYSR